MGILSRRPDSEQQPVNTSAAPSTAGSRPGYGIEEAIHLMRTLPTNQNTDLVVRVVRATLGSLDVHLPDIIEDASRKQKSVQEGIAGVRGKIADLEKQLDVHRREIAALEADLTETTGVKDRFQEAENAASAKTPSPVLGTPPASAQLLARTLLSHPSPKQPPTKP